MVGTGAVPSCKLYTEAAGAARHIERLTEVGSLSILSPAGSAMTREAAVPAELGATAGYDAEEGAEVALHRKLYLEEAGSQGQ